MLFLNREMKLLSIFMGIKMIFYENILLKEKNIIQRSIQFQQQHAFDFLCLLCAKKMNSQSSCMISISEEYFCINCQVITQFYNLLFVVLKINV